MWMLILLMTIQGYSASRHPVLVVSPPLAAHQRLDPPEWSVEQGVYIVSTEKAPHRPPLLIPSQPSPPVADDIAAFSHITPSSQTAALFHKHAFIQCFVLLVSGPRNNMWKCMDLFATHADISGILSCQLRF